MLKLRDDSGVAMVTAIMAGLVVLVMSTMAFQLANHNLDQSANDRRRVQAIHAAEAGLDHYLEYLVNSAAVASPPCALPEQILSIDPAATFTATATYYWNEDLTGTSAGPANCSFATTTPPTFAVIRSVGTVAGRTRTMETKVQLLPNAGSALSRYAVQVRGTASWGSHATITNAAGTEFAANLYADTSIELKGTSTVYGSVISQGSILLSGSADVKGNATARSTLNISNSNASVRKDARSTTASVANSGTVNGSAYYCTGSAPGGTVAGSKVKECRPNEPLVEPFQTFTFVASAWQEQGHTVNTFAACSDAQAFLAALPAGDQVVRVNNTCDLTIPAVTMRGSLAIITNGTIKGSGQTSITRTGSSPTWTLDLMSHVTYSPVTTGGPSCPNNAGITLSAGVTFPTAVDVLFYTACNVTFSGNASANIQGQIIAGGDVTFTSAGANITYKPIIVPGTASVGFRESVRYRSEVRT